MILNSLVDISKPANTNAVSQNTLLIIKESDSFDESFAGLLMLAGIVPYFVHPLQVLNGAVSLPFADVVMMEYNWQNNLALRGYQLTHNFSKDIPIILVGKEQPTLLSGVRQIGHFQGFPFAADLICVIQKYLER